MNRALLVGAAPPLQLGYEYTQNEPFDAVVIGSLSLAELLQFQNEQVLQALSNGLPVFLYTPGLPQSPKNRALSASLAAAQRQLKNWGVVFTDGGQKRLITAKQAQEMRAAGRRPAPDAVMTPLAREILEGLD